MDFLIESRSRTIRNNGGSVYAYDTANVSDLFEGDMRYRKGSMVLHQLRWEIGDSAFFAGTRNYLEDAELCYGFAKTIDFQQAMENASGQDLEGFFDRYVYKEGFPELVTKWSRQNSSKIKLEIAQTTSHPSVEFFPLKIEYRVSSSSKDTLITVEHNSPNQTLELDLGMSVEEVSFDPNIWLIARGSVVEGDHLDLSSISLYPNPAKDELSLYIKDRKIDEIQVLDIHGRVVSSQYVPTLKGGITTIDVGGLLNGMYFLKAVSGKESAVIKFTKFKD